MASAPPKGLPRPVSLWRRPLLVGVCFGLSYGLTQRLLDLRLPGFVQWGQSFDVRQFPGTSLESLRLRLGAEAQDLRGRLDLLEPEAEEPKPDASVPDEPASAEPELLPEAPAQVDAAAPPAPSLPPPPSQTQPPPSQP